MFVNPKCLPVLTSFVDRSLIEFYSSWTPRTPTIIKQLLLFNMFYLAFGVSKIRSILGSTWVSIWLHFGSLNPPTFSPKSIPRCINFLIHVCIDVSSIWGRFGGAKLGPCLSHVGVCWGKNAGGHRSNAFFSNLGSLRRLFWFSVDFRSMFDRCSVDFRSRFSDLFLKSIFDRFWVPRWLIFSCFSTLIPQTP